MCNSYKRGEISGDLCPHLCSENFSNIQCQGQHLGKEVVFSATWNSERIVLKAKKRHLDSLEPVYWTDSQRRRHYPDDKAFAHMANAQFRFALRRNGSWVKGFFGSHLTNAQMDSVYGLLQQTEYLFSLALRNHHAVASLLGTCGHAYAVEFLSPLETHGQRSGTFKQRAGIGLRILRTLETLESAMDEHIHQCDMKPNHFGIDKRGNVKMLDLDALGLQSAVQANIANTGHCESDRDCDFFDCAGRCNDQGLCDAVVLNDNLQYVVAQWACWLGGNVAVPLYWGHPRPVLEYYIKDSQSAALVATADFADRLQPIATDLNLPLLVLDSKDTTGDIDIPKQKAEEWKRLKHKDAQILYTSGTTGPPKGVVTTHHNLFVQAAALISAWEYSSSDVVLHTLPLHHTHGIVNALVTPLYAGGTCVMLPKFDAAEVWKRLIEAPSQGPRVNMFMAVPTIYAKLIEHYDREFSSGMSYSRSKEFIRATCLQKLRLMVSGSASLPLPVLERWKEITGHTLLERYGMTEIGMALTNPLHGSRKPGFVGKPFPGVKVCIAKPNAYSPTGYNILSSGDTYGTKVSKGHENESGDLLVKGPNVFKEYWNRPEATKEAFTSDGWFKTGDTAECQGGDYRILGRTSSDIIKSGGYQR
ncbi:acyl-CoA synthetase, putative [Ixodes scapularis]|uniref:Acyl-CoA synthetase, putative n=1 Tax=Ixodes scapularis TaxID=6945 RepID=B7Q937_IXOSC|nr:acyl-CoA synthetase, putative [Ixodes scapularis]|eukprot:XP_002412456.1 acyl-CoA synthetase, putative [Ixodes scapularis]